MSKETLRKVTGLALIVLGSFCIFYSTKLIIKRNTPVDFSYSQNQIANIEGRNYPISIEFHNLGLKLPITPKNITNGKWDDPDNSVGYWISSPLPGQQGNSVMYGHNWPNILAKLPKVTKGDTITVTFADNTDQTFTVASTYVVTADQTHILNQTNDIRLTIYTCTGFLDSKRFVVVATPKNP